MIRVAVVGFGKIARDQHLPAIVGHSEFDLVATVSPHSPPPAGVRGFRSLDELLAAGGVDAVALTMPPGPRLAAARAALAAGLHVLLEKPPAATLGGVDAIVEAAPAGVSLYAGWHSQHAAGVAAAAETLRGRTVRRVAVEWLESVRKWHPGQEWIWEPGGFGVFDPGINALSICSRLLPEPLVVERAELLFPADKRAPIAAELAFAGGHTAEFDWRYEEGERWTIRVETDGPAVELLDGGARLVVDGVERAVDGPGEYPSIYARWAELIAAGASEVDREPLRVVADAFLVGERRTVEAFEA